MKNQLKQTLVSAVTKYDEKEFARARKNPRAHYNLYALPQYLSRVDDIMRDIESGADPEKAITAGFTGRLRNAVLKAAGFEKNNSENPGLVYKPVSEK